MEEQFDDLQLERDEADEELAGSQEHNDDHHQHKSGHIIEEVTEWIELFDDHHKRFYYANVVTKETTWEPPPTFISHEEIRASIHTGDSNNATENSPPNKPNDISKIKSIPGSPVMPVSDTVEPPTACSIPLFALEQHALYPFAKKHFTLTTKSRFGSVKQLNLATRLAWENQVLTTPLTNRLPRENVKSALQAYRNVSSFVGTRSSGKAQMDHCFKLLRNVMPKCIELKDEVYCQLVKQLTQSPFPKTLVNGWLLLNVCLVTFRPSRELQPFLEQFLCENVGSSNKDIAWFANESLEALRMYATHAERKEIPSLREVVALREHLLVEVDVRLIDNTEVRIPVTAWTTCQDLAHAVAEKIGLQDGGEAFVLVELSPEEEERFLEPDERILDLCALWERMSGDDPKKKKNKPTDIPKGNSKSKTTIKELLTSANAGAINQVVTKNSSTSNNANATSLYTLLYKVYLFPHLDQDMPEETNLFYQQAMNDIQNGVYVCSQQDCIELGALQLQCMVGDEQTVEPDFVLANLTTLIPAQFISDKIRNDLVTQLLGTFARLPARSIQESKLAYLARCEKLELYGSTFFVVRNTRLRQLPRELVLAVNIKGVALVSETDELLLQHIAYEDIASWGYSANAFVFVVSVFGQEDQEYVLKTSKGKDINDLVAAYVQHIIATTSADKQK